MYILFPKELSTYCSVESAESSEAVEAAATPLDVQFPDPEENKSSYHQLLTAEISEIRVV